MLLVVVGTRPEAVKLRKVIEALRAKSLSVTVLGTGQHTDLLAQTHLPIDHDLAIPNSGDPLQFGESVATALRQYLYENATVSEKVQAVVCQGDTASAWGAAKGGYAAGLPVIHIEAGVRSWDDQNPYPEERFRREIDLLSDWHFCATKENAENLVRENHTKLAHPHSYVVGNPGIDALYENVTPQTKRERRVLVTLHRRESFGAPLKAIFDGLVQATLALQDREFWWPVHPNPAVRAVLPTLWNRPWPIPFLNGNFHLLDPMEPEAFQYALARSQAVLTDSGGVQEEAAALGIPCVVARDLTDRPESVASGHAILAGRTSEGVRDGLIKAVRNGLNSTPFLGFGDGKASERIADILAAHFS